MDYAKLAYLKAEDLEARLQQNTSLSRVTKTSAGQAVLLAGVITELASVKGAGAAAIFVTLKLDGGAGAEIALLLNGKRAGTEQIAQTVSFMVSADLDEVTHISVCAPAEVTLIKADLMVIGDAAFGGAGCAARVDTVDGRLAVIKTENGAIRFYEAADLTAPVLEQGMLLGFGGCADVCAYTYGGERVWAAVHTDSCRNAFLSVIKKSGGIYTLKKCVFLASGIDSAALLAHSDSLVFGFVRDGAAYAAAITPDLIIEAVTRIDAADRIELIKNSIPPIAMVCGGGKNVLRVAENELNARDCIKIDLSSNLTLRD